MKIARELTSLFCFVCLAIGVVRCSDKAALEHQIRKSEPFQFKGKEWHCAYTPKQVDINLLEDQIAELKK